MFILSEFSNVHIYPANDMPSIGPLEVQLRVIQYPVSVPHSIITWCS